MTCILLTWILGILKFLFALALILGILAITMSVLDRVMSNNARKWAAELRSEFTDNEIDLVHSYFEQQAAAQAREERTQ